jgi:thymidylate synthase
MSVVVLESQTLGEGWLNASRAILEEGALARYDGQRTRELALLTLVVARPSPNDPVIARLGDAQWLDWMHENFFVEKDVPELGDAKSYAVRLFNYAGSGRDQIAWVVERLRDGALELVVYAHSLDFGKKAYGNLVELARLQEHVAGELGAPSGPLVVHAKSAHVYEPEWSAMASIVGAGPMATLR